MASSFSFQVYNLSNTLHLEQLWSRLLLNMCNKIFIQNTQNIHIIHNIHIQSIQKYTSQLTSNKISLSTITLNILGKFCTAGPWPTKSISLWPVFVSSLLELMPKSLLDRHAVILKWVNMQIFLALCLLLSSLWTEGLIFLSVQCP